jgi:phosphopentomutase
MAKRVFLIVLDSFGIGAEPDAAAFGDAGTNTLRAIAQHPNFNCPNLTRLGLFNIDGTAEAGRPASAAPAGAFARLQEQSMGKDTTIGHWEIAGVVSPRPLPTFPNGFPDEVIREFEQKTGHKVLCNKPYSGTQVLHDYGEQAMAENALIVYTSADSVFQVAANEEQVPVPELYRYCEIAREMLHGEQLGVGRVIARPYLGHTADTFRRTTNRHDLSLKPPRATMLDVLKAAGKDVIAVGKISDIFDGEGVTEKIKTTGNTNGIAFTKALQTRDFEGLAFVNLVDFDMLYGHRRDVAGYAAAATEFDAFLADFLPGMREDDLLMVTADHGCDPSYTKTTDHTREYVPYLVCGKPVRAGVNLGTRLCFGAIAKTICDYLGVENQLDGTSVLNEILE